MRIGPLRDRVIVYKKAATSKNTYGEDVAGYTVKQFETWAAIDDMTALSGKKLMVAQQILAEGDHVVRVRYRSGLNPSQRIKTVVDGRIFDVQSVINVDTANREAWFRCKETNPQS